MSLADILSRSGAAGKGLPKRFQPFLAQALNEAAVRYSPQYDALNQLRQQSADTMRQSISQAQAAGQLNAALALEAHKAIAGDNSTAIQQALAYQQAPPGSSTQRVGLGISLGHDATGNILAQSAADAPIVAAQQGLQARALHQQDLQKIQGQRDSILGQVGNYVTGRENDLVTADRKQRATLNQNLRQIKAGFVTAGVDPTTGQVVKGGPKDPAITHPTKPPAGPSTIAKPPASYPGSAADWNNASRADRERWLKNHPTGRGGAGPSGIKPATPGQHGALQDRINYGIGIAKTHKQQGDSRSLTGQILTQGVPAFTAPGGGKVPAVKSLPQLSASIALDIAYDGHVSRKNVVELHRRGFSLAQLGFPTKAKPQVAGPPAPAGPAGRPA